jgi:hypothetical protein
MPDNSHPRHDKNGPLNIWPLLGLPESGASLPNADLFRAAAANLAELVSPVLTDYLLAPAAGIASQPLLDPAAVERDRLIKRFTLAQHRRWAGAIVAADFDVVFIKGFANAHTLYPDPSLRIQGDLDILVWPADLERLTDFLVAQGFSCRVADNNPWGMISDASFLPFVSADGASHIDIHIHPDSYPAHRTLSTDLVFADSRQVDAGGVVFRVPSDDHSLLLCVTNAAKDKFNISSVGKIIDAIMVLKSGRALDWDRIAVLGKDGGFLLPLRVFLALLDGLGVAMGDVPRRLYEPLGGLRGMALRQVLDDFRAFFPQELPMTTLLWREMTICAEPLVALHNTGLRLKGLVRPWAGIPENIPATTNLPLTDSSHAGP